MARRGRRRRRGALGQYGYPTNQELKKEARGLARAAVPTVRAVRRPYMRERQSVADYLDAVLAALKTSGADVGQTYDSAQASQQAVSDAAQARLAGLGLGEYGAGVQAAQGARDDSAMASLISQGAAARGYAAKQPGIAAGYARSQDATLSKEMRDALANRRDQMSSAFQQAFQNVQASALQRAQFAASVDQFRQNMQLQRDQMALQASQFDRSQAQQQYQWRWEQTAATGVDPVTGKRVKLPGAQKSAMQALQENDPVQFRNWMQDANDTLNDALNGVPNENYGKWKVVPKGTKNAVQDEDTGEWKVQDFRKWEVQPFYSAKGQKNRGSSFTPEGLYAIMRNAGIPDPIIFTQMQLVFGPWMTRNIKSLTGQLKVPRWQRAPQLH